MSRDKVAGSTRRHRLVVFAAVSGKVNRGNGAEG
jgi:hypothetical protein